MKKIKYNSPVTDTFLFICVGVLLLNIPYPNFVYNLFCTHGYIDYSPLGIWCSFSHVAGHASWQHLYNNSIFILLLGHLVEEKYGSSKLLFMIIITAFITALFNNFFFNTGLLGSSGIVFMLIVLSSFTNIKNDEIAFGTILIVLVFLSKELVNMFSHNSVSEFAHLIGAACGLFFGMIYKNSDI